MIVIWSRQFVKLPGKFIPMARYCHMFHGLLRSNQSFSSTKIRLRLKFTVQMKLKQKLCINQVCFRIGCPFFQILPLRIVKVNYLLIFFVHQSAPTFIPRLKSLERTQISLDCSTNVSNQWSSHWVKQVILCIAVLWLTILIATRQVWLLFTISFLILIIESSSFSRVSNSKVG